MVGTLRARHTRELTLTDPRSGLDLEVQMETHDRRAEGGNSIYFGFRGRPDRLKRIQPSTGDGETTFVLRGLGLTLPRVTSTPQQRDSTHWILGFYNVPCEELSVPPALFQEVIHKYFGSSHHGA